MSTRLTSPKRVLSWWWSMLMQQLSPVAEEVDRHAVDVAAVEEDDRAVRHVRRRLVEDLLEGQEAVLDRQRELLRGHEHHRVLAELGEQLVHAEQRPERVAVGALVGGQQEAVALAQLGRRSARSAIASPPRPPRSPALLLRRAGGRSASPARSSRRSGRSRSGCASSASRRRSATGSRRARSAIPPSSSARSARRRARSRAPLRSAGPGWSRPRSRSRSRGGGRPARWRSPRRHLAKHLVDAAHARRRPSYSRVCSTCLVWKNSSTSPSLTSA